MVKTIRNTLEFEVFGDYALFTDPISKISEEKYSYPVPTYSALKGIAEKIYWKPTIQYVIDEVRIMNEIKRESRMYNDKFKDTEANYRKVNPTNHTYLKDVRYQVRIHFEFDENRPDLLQDRNENKHFSIFKRSLEKGGRRPICLGTSECPAYVKPCKFGEDTGYYDDIECKSYGVMLHGITYPTNDDTQVSARLWDVSMHYGVIKFIRPEECVIPSIKLSNYPYKHFVLGENLTSVDDELAILEK